MPKTKIPFNFLGDFLKTVKTIFRNWKKCYGYQLNSTSQFISMLLVGEDRTLENYAKVNIRSVFIQLKIRESRPRFREFIDEMRLIISNIISGDLGERKIQCLTFLFLPHRQRLIQVQLILGMVLK